MRAISLRVCPKTRLFFTSPRCCCKRRLNNFKRNSLSSRDASLTVYSAICLRRSLAFDTFRLPSYNKAGRNGKFVAGEANRLFGNLLADAANLKNDASRLDNGNPMINRALTATHTGFGRLGSNWFIGKDTNPHFTTALHKAGESDTCRLDLAGLHPAWLKCL